MTETPSSGVQPFSIGDIQFRCFSLADGRLVWRSVSQGTDTVLTGADALAAGRMGAKCWARCAGEIVGKDFADLRSAMIAATLARAGRRAV